MQINLKHWRMKRGLSQLQLSKRTGITRSYISEIEKGIHKNLGANMICSLCRALECTPNDLIECGDD